jgi:hypothetical protein
MNLAEQIQNTSELIAHLNKFWPRYDYDHGRYFDENKLYMDYNALVRKSVAHLTKLKKDELAVINPPKVIRDSVLILDFMRGHTPDHKGRFYHEILAFDDAELEKCHDHIQWMFPLHEKSNFASTYPLIDKKMAGVMCKDKRIIYNMQAAAHRMMMFYGIGPYLDDDKIKGWCKVGDHNLLLITRIIRSLRLCDLKNEAEWFDIHARTAADIADMRDEKTLDYWKVAACGFIWGSMK